MARDRPKRRHRIGLDAAWTREGLPANGPTSERVRLPDRSFESEAIYKRCFNRPSGLGPNAVVYLCLDRWHGRLQSATLNNVALQFEDAAAVYSMEIDVTSHLRSFNEICLQLISDGQGVGIDANVRLEIVD